MQAILNKLESFGKKEPQLSQTGLCVTMWCIVLVVDVGRSRLILCGIPPWIGVLGAVRKHAEKS